METWVCTTCGTQFPPSEAMPERCPICEDERQYVGRGGQNWTTLAQMRFAGYRNAYHAHEPDLFGIGTVPGFAIGQNAKLVRTPQGNVLWDCITYIDDATVEIIKGLGGISAIAISHPHFYSAMVEWAERFDAPIYLNEHDRGWVMRKSERIHFWDGAEHALNNDVTLVQVGGHFAGSTVLCWHAGAQGRGALLTGDTVSLGADPRWVSFMYSFPNRIPLGEQVIQRVKQRLASVEFDRLYGMQEEAFISTGAKTAVMQSADRYIEALRRTDER